MAEYKTLSFMLDCSRNAVPNMAFLKRFIDILAEIGYNELQLYTEDTYKIESEPYFGYLRGGFSRDEIKEIDKYCIEKGIELVPCIQTLAHLDRIFRWQRFNSTILDFGNVLLADNEETYKFIEKEFCEIAQCFSSRKVNLGMDEAHCLGLGRHLKDYGYENSKDIFFRHLNKVLEIAERYGFKARMWSDMFIKFDNNGQYPVLNPKVSDDTKNLVPKNVNLIYWDYNQRDRKVYQSMLDAHKFLGEKDVTGAGAYWSWLGIMPRNDYSLLGQKAAYTVMKKNGVENYMLTFWGDDGEECSKLALLPTIFHFAEMAKGNCDEEDIARKFKEKFGIGFDEFLSIDLPNLIDEQEPDVYNPSKYMLYNDCFLGIYDYTVDENAKAGKKYTAYSKKLGKLASDEKFGYVFDTAAKLCKVLSLKYEIGVKTRSAYKNGDKDAMAKIIADYTKIIRYLETFYQSFKKQWYTENKGFGFEVQAARIGGLIRRVKDCREMLQDWIKGDVDKVDELEEEINLDVYGRGCDEKYKGKTIVANVYHDCMTTGY